MRASTDNSEFALNFMTSDDSQDKANAIFFASADMVQSILYFTSEKWNTKKNRSNWISYNKIKHDRISQFDALRRVTAQT